MAEKELKVAIKLNVDEMTHSHILMLKKLFSENLGHISVALNFVSKEEKALGQIFIGHEWGIRFDGQLEMHLKRLPFIKSVQLVTQTH